MAEKICLLLLAFTTALVTVNASKILLISFDGFRWDYINKATMPNFDKLINGGSHVKKVTNAFATVTMPNHYTLVTGLYEEDHGIINNRFYDPIYNDTYSYSTGTKWYNATEPIWITAEREGKKSGAFMWIGNEAEYEGVTVSKVTPFKSDQDFREAIDSVVGWFALDDIELACLYTDHPDKEGHSFGPDSDELQQKLEDLDGDLGYLIEKLEKANIEDEINILITADHGMTNVDNSRTIDMSQYLDYDEEVEWSYLSAVGLIRPKHGKLQQVFDKLDGVSDHFTVYKKEDIPDDLHYSNNERIPPIVIVVEKGWLLKKTNYTMNLKGNHGFDNKEDDMKTTFIAYGPDFKCGEKQETMNSVDLYPLMCKVLGLETCHAGGGSLSQTEGLLSTEACHIKSSAFPVNLSLGLLAALMLAKMAL